jgi:hypothetical protein
MPIIWLYEVKQKVSWTRVRLPPGPPENFLSNYTGTAEILANSRQSKDQPGRWVTVVSSTSEGFLMGQPWFRQGKE